MKRLTVALFLAFAMAASALAGDSLVIQDFESDFNVGKWPAKGKLEFSTEWAKDGKRSLKIYNNTMAAISDMKTKNWKAYQIWRFHVYVPGKEGVNIGLELTDSVASTYHDRHQNSSSAPPGESVVDIDIGGAMWRGEKNKPYLKNKNPIYTGKMSRFAITAKGGDIYVDRVELLKVEKLECTGGYAFDFGFSGTTVQSQWIEINQNSRYNDGKGYGHSGGVTSVKPVTPYPTYVMGDGLRMNSSTFSAKLKGGKYLGWIVFERSGFWGGQQAAYERAALSCNGSEVHSHTGKVDDPYFKLQDVEAFTIDDVVDKIVMVRQKAADFKFNARDGKNDFKLSASGPGYRAPRIGGLVLAPDNAEGRKFLEAHKKLQLEIIAKTHAVLTKARREGDPKATREALVVRSIPTDRAVYPRDWPKENASADIPKMNAFAGLTVHRAMGAYAKRECELSVDMSAMRGPGGSLPADAVKVSYGLYLPTHKYEVTACNIEVHDYRPFTGKVKAGPELARAVLVSVTIPEGTRAGAYKGTLTLKGGAGATVRKAIAVEVHSGNLPRIPKPVGLFFSGVPIPRDMMSDATYWKLSESLFRTLEMGGITMLTSGPGFKIRWNGGTPVIEGADAVRYFKIARKYGLDKAMVNYGGLSIGGLLGNIGSHGDTDGKKLNAAWEKFSRDNGLPPYYVNSFDEPRVDYHFPPIKAKLGKLRRSGFRSIGWTSMSDPAKTDANHKMLVTDSHSAAFNGHNKKVLDYAKSVGNEPWVYNNGASRYAKSVHLWRNFRCGANGRIDWITSIVQGYQFDALDAREPDLSSVYYHKELGVLLAPRFLATCEGSIDARMLFELERRLAARPTAAWASKVKALFGELESRPYGRNAPEMSWDELEKLRERLIALMKQSA